MWLYDPTTGAITKQPASTTPPADQTAWLHLERPTASELQAVLGGQFGAHELAVEIAQTDGGEHPGLHMFRDHAYLKFYALCPDGSFTQVGLLIGANYLITLAAAPLSFLRAVEERLRESPQRMRDPGRVLHVFLDCLVEDYLTRVDEIVGEVHQIERLVFDNPFENEIGHRIFRWKRELHRLRRVVEEEHHIVGVLADPSFPYAAEETAYFLQDLDQSFGRVVGAFDQLRDQMQGLFDLQMTLKSDHMNVIMKTLTLVSVLFLPLTFLAGIYGMNFEHMPELGWRFGYPALLGFMLLVALSAIFYFKKRRWW